MGFKISWINGNPIVRFDGVIDSSIVLASFEKILGDSRFDMMSYVIANYLEIDSVNMKNFDLKMIQSTVKSASRWNPKVKDASITTNPDMINLINGFNNFMKITSWECKHFENMDDALKWCKG